MYRNQIYAPRCHVCRCLSILFSNIFYHKISKKSRGLSKNKSPTRSKAFNYGVNEGGRTLDLQGHNLAL